MNAGTERAAGEYGGGRRQGWIEEYLEFTRRVRSGLVGVYFLMAKKPLTSYPLSVLAIFVDGLQMLSFAFVNQGVIDFALPPLMQRLSIMAGFFNIGMRIQEQVGFSESLYLAYVAVVLQLLSTFYVGYSWTKQDFSHIWPIKVLRAVTSVTAGVLYIPILSVLASSFLKCDYFATPVEDSTCTWLQLTSVLLAIIFVPISIGAMLTLYDPSPFSKSPMAR